MKMPTFDSMMNPLLKALSELGGSGKISEMVKITGCSLYHGATRKNRSFLIK